MAHASGFPLADGQRKGVRQSWRGVGVGRACPRPQHGQSWIGSSRLGCRSQTKGLATFKTHWRRSRRDCLRRFSGDQRIAGRTLRHGAKRTCHGVPAHQDKNQAGEGFGTGAPPAAGFSAHQADGGRQLRSEAKQKGLPLSKLIGGVREEIACGVSVGIKESLDELSATVQRELATGYQRIKIKIKPGKDLELVRRLRQDFPRIKLMVDANSDRKPNKRACHFQNSLEAFAKRLLAAFQWGSKNRWTNSPPRCKENLPRGTSASR